MRKIGIALIVAVGLVAVGCSSSETTATKAQEDAFRHPPKEPPAGLGAPSGPPAQGGQ